MPGDSENSRGFPCPAKKGGSASNSHARKERIHYVFAQRENLSHPTVSINPTSFNTLALFPVHPEVIHNYNLPTSL